MAEVSDLQSPDQQAYYAFRRVQDVLDTLPADHPAVPLLVEAAAVAARHWRALRETAEATERAATTSREPAPQRQAAATREG